jgi:hypothetical protein
MNLDRYNYVHLDGKAAPIPFAAATLAKRYCEEAKAGWPEPKAKTPEEILDEVIVYGYSESLIKP